MATRTSIACRSPMISMASKSSTPTYGESHCCKTSHQHRMQSSQACMFCWFVLSEAHHMLRRGSPNASAAQAAQRRLLNNSRQSTLRLLAGAQYHAIFLGLPVSKLNGSFTRTMALPGRRMLPTGSNKNRVDSIKQPPEKPVRRLGSCIIISLSLSHPTTHPTCLRPPTLIPAPPHSRASPPPPSPPPHPPPGPLPPHPQAVAMINFIH